MKSKDLYIAAGLTVAALLGWAGVVSFVRHISDAKTVRVVEIQDSQNAAVQQGSLVRLHAIAKDTAQDRARLDQLLSVDVGSAATMLRAVGNKTNVTVKLSGALPEISPPAAPSGPQIHAVGFAVQADGTFETLMRTLHLFETLPLASSVERLDIQRAQDSGGLWHMSVYIRVLTTSAVSS